MITAEIAKTEESPSSGERSGTRGRGSLVWVLAGKSEIESNYPATIWSEAYKQSRLSVAKNSGKNCSYVFLFTFRCKN